MTPVDLKKYGMEELEMQREHLNLINTVSPNAVPNFDVMSGAIIWSDETTPQTPTKVIWALRLLFSYRTKLMREESCRYGEAWVYCQTLFPNWIGFLPERRIYTSEVQEEYRRGYTSMKWCIRDK